MAYKNYIELPVDLGIETEQKIVSAMPRWKRTLDIIASGFALVLLSPLFLAVALIIKITSPGPVFYRQNRLGFKGQIFTMWKFRSMHVNASINTHKSHLKDLIVNNNPMQKLDENNDPRIFTFGTRLRKTGIDELPQLINVLKGEMSLVGPRPCLPYEAEIYQDWQKKRFFAVPGITGLWQVNGKNKTTFTQMIYYDIEYINNKNLWMDLKIILFTVPALILH